MACFWNGFIKGLSTKKLEEKKINKKPIDFIKYLKENNKKTTSMNWCDSELTEKQLDENFNAIKEYEPKNFNNGYLCSTFDPFIFLIGELFDVSIEHKYLNNTIKYKNKKNPNKILLFGSNKGHFWFSKEKNIEK